MKKFALGRNIKYGVGSSVIALLLIIILIFVNLGVESLSHRFPLKADLTTEKLYHLSDYTKNVLHALNKPVNIYAIYNLSNTNDGILEILYRYQRESEQVHVQVVDSQNNPEFSVKYSDQAAALTEGSIVFDCEGTYQVVSESDLTNYSAYTQTATSLYAENKFTQAIEFVAAGVKKKVYTVSGHGEDNGYQMNAVLLQAGYEREEISLMSGAVPEDATLLMILAPKRDFQPAEISVLDAYLSAGGGLFITLDAAVKTLDTLEGFLAEWGITTAEEIVYEGDQSKVAFNTPMTFYATGAGHIITGDIFTNKLLVLVANTKPIYVSAVSGVDTRSIISTSEKGFVRELTDINGEGIQKGTVAVAAAAQRENGKIVIYGSDKYFVDEIFSEPAIADKDLFLNSLGWVSGEQNTGIRPKSLTSDTLMLSYMQTVVIMIIVCLIPVIILVMGIVVWMRRRRT